MPNVYIPNMNVRPMTISATRRKRRRFASDIFASPVQQSAQNRAIANRYRPTAPAIGKASIGSRKVESKARHSPALDRDSSKTILLCHYRGRVMATPAAKIIEVLILALPETAGSAIYGLIDVFASTGTLWRELVGDEPGRRLIRPKIVSLARDPFLCGNGIPVNPELTIGERSIADIIVVPALLLAPDDDLKDRYPELKE